MPAIYLLCVVVYIILYVSGVCNIHGKDIGQTMTVVNILYNICVIGFLPTLLSFIVWLPLFVNIIYDTPKLYTILFCTGHALLIVMFIIDLRSEVIASIFLG